MPFNELRARREAARREREARPRTNLLKPRPWDADAEDIRRRRWAGETDVNELADEYDLSDLDVEFQVRRLFFDGLPLVAGEQPLDEEKLATVASHPAAEE